jgi:hypothetical protein
MIAIQIRSLVLVIIRGIFWRIRTPLTISADSADRNRHHSTYTGACRAPAHGDHTHRHSQAANTVRQELAIKCGLSKGPPVPCYKYEPQAVLQNSSYKLYYDRPIITDRTIHRNRPNTVMLDKTIKAAHSVDAATANSHRLHSTNTEKLQKYTDLKEEPIRTWQLQTACIVPLVLSTL